MPTFNNGESAATIRTKLNNVINRTERVMLLDDVTQLASLVYTADTQWTVSAGMQIYTLKEGFCYDVLASGATTFDIQPGAVKLDLQPGPDGSYNFRGMLPAANGSTDDYPLLAKLLAKPGDGLAVYFPRGNYFMGQSIELKRTVRFHGDNGYPGNNFGRLTFAANTSGITVNRINTINGGIDASNTGAADSSVIERLAIYSAGGTDRTKFGIWLRARASLRSLYVQGFPGNGIQVIATAGGGGAAEGNANCFYIENVVCVLNGSNGFYAQGADANAGTIINLDCASNGWNGIWDDSFLGNVYLGCHTATNGNYTINGGKYYGVNFDGKYYIGHWNATEAQLVATQPGTSNSIWYDTGLTGAPNAGNPLWVSGQPVGTYFSAFNYRTDGAVAQNMFVGCYNEMDGYCAFQGAARVDSGSMANIVVGTRLGANSSGIPIISTLQATNGEHQTWLTDGGAYETWTGTPNVAQETWRWKRTTNGGIQLDNANSGARIPLRITGVSDSRPWLVNLTSALIGGVLVTGGTAAPTTGTWVRGDYVRNTNPAVGQPKGWICTVAGTPGTWVSEGNL